LSDVARAVSVAARLMNSKLEKIEGDLIGLLAVEELGPPDEE